MKHAILIFALLALASCGGKATEPDPAYFGTWKQIVDEGYWEQITISADTLIHGGNIEGYTVTGLIWEAIHEPNGNTTYPTGYKITGKVVSDGTDNGQHTFDVYYISTDGQSLMAGVVEPPHNVDPDFIPNDKLFKQPDTAGDGGDEPQKII